MNVFTGFFYLAATYIGGVNGTECVQCRHLSIDPALFGGM